MVYFNYRIIRYLLNFVGKCHAGLIHLDLILALLSEKNKTEIEATGIDDFLKLSKLK